MSCRARVSPVCPGPASEVELRETRKTGNLFLCGGNYLRSTCPGHLQSLLNRTEQHEQICGEKQITSQQNISNRNQYFRSHSPTWLSPWELPPTTALWSPRQWPPPPPWWARPITATLPGPPWWRTEWSTEWLEPGLSRPEWPVLLMDTSTLWPDRRPSPSQPPLMLSELPRTSWRPGWLVGAVKISD